MNNKTTSLFLTKAAFSHYISSTMMEKVRVEKLPVTKEIPGPKRWEDERGESAQVAYREEIRHLAVLEIRKGFSRANHYHERKEEVFYVVSGSLKALFLDIDSHDRDETTLEKGDKISIRPRCGHLFQGLEDSLIVEYSPQVYEEGDSYPLMLRPKGI
jgi:dTDP-4-dehydrorhamnose 3,5-epimerase-like enzyme